MAEVNLDPVTIKELDGSGIYIEPIGSVIFFENKWTIAGSLEIPDWENLMVNITKYSDLFNINCNTTHYCHVWHHKIDSSIRDINNKIDHIKFFSNKKKPVNVKSNLARRGLVDAVGHLSKFLFGTMDATDAAEIDRKLTEIQGQKSEIGTFMRQQITVLSNSFDLVTAPIRNLDEHQKKITSSVNKLVGQINNINAVRILETHVNDIMDNLDTVSRSLEKFTRIYSALIAHQIPIELIETSTLTHIYSELVKEKNLNSRLTQKEMFFEIAEVRWTQTANHLFYKFRFPVDMSREMYKKRIIAYPVANKESQFSIPNVLEDIVIMLENEHIFTTEEHLQTSCMNLKAFDVAHIQLCEANRFKALTQNNKGPIKIPISEETQIKFQSLRINLETKNSFLFYFLKTEKIFSLCNGKTTTKDVEGVGICVLKENCIHSLNNEILKTNKMSRTNLPHRQENISIEWDRTNITSEFPNRLETLKFNSSQDLTKYFKKINNDFVALEKSANKLREKEFQWKMTYGSISISGASILGIIILIFVMMKLTKPKEVKEVKCVKVDVTTRNLNLLEDEEQSKTATNRETKEKTHQLPAQN